MHNAADPCTTLAHADQQGMVDHRAILDFVATGRAGRLLICLSGYGNKKVEIIMPGWSARIVPATPPTPDIPAAFVPT
jgi:hypothetical protein